MKLSFAKETYLCRGLFCKKVRERERLEERDSKRERERLGEKKRE